jgi:hypothetical protein
VLSIKSPSLLSIKMISNKTLNLKSRLSCHRTHGARWQPFIVTKLGLYITLVKLEEGNRHRSPTCLTRNEL